MWTSPDPRYFTRAGPASRSPGPGRSTANCGVTGDTVLYPALREVAFRLRVGTMLLHLGSVRSGWIRYTMDACEGAELIEGRKQGMRRPYVGQVGLLRRELGSP